MTADEYVPSDQGMRWQYVVKRMHDGATRTHAEREYTRWLAAHDARVRRDAAREALDGLAEWHDREATMSGPGSHYWDASNHVATSARHHRDTHYPEETP